MSYPPAYPTGQAVSPVSYSTAAAPVSYVTQPAPVYSNYYPQPNGYASNFQDAYSYMYGLGSSYPYDIDIYNRYVTVKRVFPIDEGSLCLPL